MKIMVYECPKKLRIDEINDMPINSSQIRIRTLFSGISHGTEMNIYRGVAPFFKKKLDSDLNLFINKGNNDEWTYPIRSCDPGVWYMGYSNVGEVIEIGRNISNIKVGDIVYSEAPHQSQVIKKENEVIKLPEGIKPEYGVFFTNLLTSFNIILDSKIKLGDVAVVSGLGVLGQLSLQMVKLSGAFKVFGVDLFEKRLKVALENGAYKVYNPKTVQDIAYDIRKETNKKGADISIEVSGNQKALNEVIRIAAPDTTVIAAGWYQGKCSDLNLSEEFHHNRIIIRCSQTGEINPEIRHVWNFERKITFCLELLKKLRFDNLITNKIPFEDAPEAYKLIDKKPEDIIQILLKY